MGSYSSVPRSQEPATVRFLSQINLVHAMLSYFYKNHLESRSQICEKWLLTSSCPSVRPHGTSRLPLDRFSWNLVDEYFSKICPGYSSFIEIDTIITGTLHEDLPTFVIISRSVLLRIRNVSDKSCRENQNTHFMMNDFFPKIVPFMR